ATKIKMEITSKPVELEATDRRLMQLEMEKLSLEAEDKRTGVTGAYGASQDRLDRIEQEITILREKQQKLSGQWQSEKQLLQDISALKEEEEQLRLQIEQAERDYDLNKAAQLKYGKLEALQHDRDAKESMMLELQSLGTALLREQVTEADIAEIVAKWTGIPVKRLLESERQKLLQLEGHLHQRVIGQGDAVTAVAAAIRRARAGMKDPGRPIGSFLFMGPSGVGKTELARALAQFLFDSDDALVRIDMSEYMEKHAVSRLVGAPPGYIGYEEGGQLSEAIRRCPYSVVLLDEVEKAHRDVFNILLQVLDDGRITDSQGRTIDFRNTIIVMTSNIGSEHILRVAGDDTQSVAGDDTQSVAGDDTQSVARDDTQSVAGDDTQYEKMQKLVTNALRSHFRPEFLNRVDDIMIFHTLTRKELREIVVIQLKRVERLLAEQKISLEMSGKAQDYLANIGYDPVYGARPLKRAIQKELENAIATKILENTFIEGDTIVIDCEENALTFTKKEPINLPEPQATPLV
ncbi:MAG: AAA domain-containing protein, partial [Symploca sp. SIO3E6]|nr:AAA domain-containing protein [Caldora sp. SIO3E6]